MSAPTSFEAAAHGRTGRRSRYLPVAARYLMGLIFLVMGLNGFLDFLPHPSTPMSPGAMTFLGGLIQSGYMEPLISGTQILVALLLLTNVLVPLALVVLAPVVVNIVSFHVFLERSGLVIALFVLALELYLAWSYRSAFRSVLVLRTAPNP
ncbi:MAG: DoxX family protein [Gemmatimonadota bacterium]